MDIKEISKVLGFFLLGFSSLLILPILLALYFDFFTNSPLPSTTFAFFITFLVTLLLGGALAYYGKKAIIYLRRKECIMLVMLIWVLASILSSLPFFLSKTLENPLDALFESVSGWTTTGSTVFYPKAYDPITKEETMITVASNAQNYTFYGTIKPIIDQNGTVLLEGFNAIPKPILFWRSFLQWLGGLGIVLLFITILPILSLGGKFLFEAELPGGPYRESLTPRIKETSGYLLKIYLGLTILEVALLLLTNPDLPVFEALLLTFSTISTGGFSLHANSIAFYNNGATEWIIMLFMFLGALSFPLYFYLIKRKFNRLYDPELFLFSSSILIGIFLIFITLAFGKKAFFSYEVFRQSCFQFISANTCTGFYSTNFMTWPLACQTFMIIAMYLGGMSGSTSGGIKTSRISILFKAIKYRLETLFRPAAIQILRFHDREISIRPLLTVFAFFSIVVFFSILGILLLVFNQIDLKTAVGSIASSLNNAGLSITDSGLISTCAFMPSFSKLIMLIWMLFGRLEYFAFLMLLMPTFWRAK